LHSFILSIINSKNILEYKDESFSLIDSLEAKKYISFDIQQNFSRYINDENFFCYDLDILFKLRGYKFDSFNELIKLCFDDNSLHSYWQSFHNLNSYIKSYKFSKIDIGKFEIDKLFPEKIWLSFFKEKIFLMIKLYDIIKDEKDIFDFYEDFFYEKCQNIFDISTNYIYFDRNFILNDPIENSYILGFLKEHDRMKLKFNFVGAKTGRLGFKKNTFNLYNLPKTLRQSILPKEGHKIVEFDFKNFQPRLAICSTDDENFKNKFNNIEDIYSVFDGDRDKNKIELISWMYSNQKNLKFEKEAFPIKNLRNILFNKSKENRKIVNTFGRPLFFDGNSEDHVVFQNYITSIEVDAILSLMKELDNFKKTNNFFRVLFSFHDAIVCEVNEKNIQIVSEIKSIIEFKMFSMFNFYFPVTFKVGNNYGMLS
jgi:hypothetical protein